MPKQKKVKPVVAALISLNLWHSMPGVVLAQSVSTNTSGSSTQTPALIDNSAAANVSNLTVDSKHAVAVDFGKLGASGLKLSGLLSNSGVIYAFSSNPDVKVANIHAANITNNAGALFTSIIPTSGISGLNLNLSNLVPLSLAFSATQSFVNAGTICKPVGDCKSNHEHRHHDSDAKHQHSCTDKHSQHRAHRFANGQHHCDDGFVEQCQCNNASHRRSNQHTRYARRQFEH